MKNIKTPILIIVCISTIFLFSCESHESAADDAFLEVKKDKKNPSTIDEQETTLAIATVESKDKIVYITKKVASSDWMLFAQDIDKKILINKSMIKELKGSSLTSSKLLRRIIILEKDNLSYDQELLNYKQEEKIRWESFKMKMNQEVSALEIELKSMEQVPQK